jgi:Fe-S-cluster-containing hydrogenase component 2
MEIEAKNGTVLILEEKCTGCGICVQACPFRAIRLDEGEKKAWKCDFCGGDPQCFAWCPANALGVVEFGGEIPK